ncbi:uncharacterized protein M437DRAFT_89239 [Aureobasidium melanogenum CBS 110374]|uniref:Uncharacterized protein n=1 Tax=Aureobasidium melanogenum (strain CBS 110374) TaxID=1043003 RepID=A0A074VJB4_AURM1|nr:uncharacterized protein M437DRAFT_89239 [Aureobasidium melanogenum CBS 110374]KEQ57697.1 hypothetical protein M437DRAFT_89239 [Aureobasidium melanogenum CBS 110374]
MLTSLLPGVSSNWLVDQEDGFQFFLGVRHILQGFLQRQEAADSIMRYVLGLYVYWEVTAPYFQPRQQSSAHAGLVPDLKTIVRRYLGDSPHTVLGLGSTIFPILAEVGQHYRRMVEGQDCLTEMHEDELEAQLLNWKVPEQAHRSPDNHPMLRLLADAHRWTGIVMLYQAVSVQTKLTSERRDLMDRAIVSVMETLRLMPSGSSYETAVPFLAIVVGSELRQQDLGYRAMLRAFQGRLEQSVRVRAYSDMFQQLSRLWNRRDAGESLTWLELMYEEAFFPPIV